MSRAGFTRHNSPPQARDASCLPVLRSVTRGPAR